MKESIPPEVYMPTLRLDLHNAYIIPTSFGVLVVTSTCIRLVSSCQMGHGFTYEALRQHLQKLIRKDKAAGGANDSSDNYVGARPGRLAELRPSDQRPTRRAGQKRLAPVYDDGEDDEEYKRPRKLARVKKEQVPRKMGQMEDDEPKPPKDDEEYWGESDQLQPSALLNSSLSLNNNNFDAEAPPVLADKAYPSDLLA
ncbi:hypothetical protein K449DRAFT_392337 [Hypoxylon sp. EC38]|nr:hypothetical protein K449DRAFT_392337 [Hypoxylon sp. EC38]